MGVRAAFAAALATVLLVAAPAAGDPGERKREVDAELGDLRERAERQGERVGILTEELSAFTGRVRELEGAISAQQARLSVLEARLAEARSRLDELDRRIADQTLRLERLRRTYAVALQRLEERVRAIYVADEPDILSFALGSSSFTDLLDNMELLGRIGRQDEQIVRRVAGTRDALATTRRATRAARTEAAAVTARISSSAAEQRAVVGRLAATRDSLTVAQADRRSAIASIRADHEQVLREIETLERESATLAAAIQAAQSAAGSTSTGRVTVVGNGTLAWPVSGPVTSGFGPRWGRMHEGIDIAVPTGTPVGAAAAGTIIYAGWLGGYGNLVVVDHGGGLSTAYAHNSSFTVGVGSPVERGTVVAYSGNTGASSGPHVHFEVRVNGAATDPLGYL
jgi:murein DD-endopeptidase MepM/ murein hydrolase activator NlpD